MLLKIIVPYLIALISFVILQFIPLLAFNLGAFLLAVVIIMTGIGTLNLMQFIREL